MLFSGTLTTVFSPFVSLFQNVIDVSFGVFSPLLSLVGVSTPSLIGALNSLLGTTFV